jgi:hypothetical protein
MTKILYLLSNSAIILYRLKPRWPDPHPDWAMQTASQNKDCRPWPIP